MHRLLFEEHTAVMTFLQNQKTRVYLVGGAVRDMLRNLPTHDLDFVVLGDATSLARHTSNHFNGAFYRLDAERDTARVLFDYQQEGQFIMDFTRVRGGSLEKDLQGRDFTINAIAFDLKRQEFIDPLDGQQDLQEGILRACTPESFENDPVRLLRALRFSLYQGLRMEPQTREWMYRSVPLLPGVSGERVRDELFRMLESGKSGTALRLMQRTGMLDFVLSELIDLFNTDTAKTISLNSERLFSILKKADVILNLGEKKQEENRENMSTGILILHFGALWPPLHDHLARKTNANRSPRALLLYTAVFAAAILDGYEPTAVQRAYFSCSKRLALSNAEIQRGQTILENYIFLLNLLQDPEPPDRSTIYRFFNKCGEAGIDLCILSLAAIWAVSDVEMVPEIWANQVDQCAHLLSAWWNHRVEYIDPPQIISGNELMETMGLEPGPLVGLALSRIREAQAVGKISQRSEAMALAQEIVRLQSGKNTL